MARKAIRPNQTVKLLDIDGQFWDGYRGNSEIIWSWFYNKNRILVEKFATCCKCGSWYGWIESIQDVETLHKKLKKSGCKRCRNVR